MHFSALTLFAISSVVLWRVISRFRRNIGRQRSSVRRHGITLVIFPSLVLLLAWLSWQHPTAEFALETGCVAGAILAMPGLRLTSLEAIRGEGFFYTPNPYIGLALSLLFLGRMAWRGIQILGDQSFTGAHHYIPAPVTLLIFGLLAGYNIAYAIGLLRWRQAILQRKRSREQ